MASKRTLRSPFPFSVEAELKKNPEMKISDVEILREWCSQQRHFIDVPDFVIIFCLQSNYFNMEAAKKTIENYLTMKTHIPEFFSNRDPLGTKDLRRCFSVLTAVGLPKDSNDGYKVIFTRLLDTDPSNYSFAQCTKLFFMISELKTLEVGTYKGLCCVIDSTGVSLGHAGRLNPSSLKKLVYYLQEAIPVRLKAMHFINTPPALDIIMNMMKPFMKKELWNLIHLHPTLKTLEKFIDLDSLPNEIGGKAGPLMELHEAQIRELEENRDYFLSEEELVRVDESKRVGKCMTAGDLFGVDGSFKKLEID